jgi:hypothetical protein
MTSNQYSLVSNTYQGQKVSSPVNLNMGQETVPHYPSFGYHALTHGGVGNGLGYYNVSGAYPCYDHSCTRFGPRLCSGLVKGPASFSVGKPPNLPSALIQDSGPGPVRMAKSHDNDDPTRTPDANRASHMNPMAHVNRHQSGHHSPYHQTVSHQPHNVSVHHNSVNALNDLSPHIQAGHMNY